MKKTRVCVEEGGAVGGTARGPGGTGEAMNSSFSWLSYASVKDGMTCR